MDKLNQVIAGVNRRHAARPEGRPVTPKPKKLTKAETEKFAQVFVRDYGETLVLLSKE
jgi:hypothetical protein